MRIYWCITVKNDHSSKRSVLFWRYTGSFILFRWLISAPERSFLCWIYARGFRHAAEIESYVSDPEACGVPELRRSCHAAVPDPVEAHTLKYMKRICSDVGAGLQTKYTKIYGMLCFVDPLHRSDTGYKRSNFTVVLVNTIPHQPKNKVCALLREFRVKKKSYFPQ